MKVTQPCPTLCDPMDCSPVGYSVHGGSPCKDTGVGCHALLQGIFPTQGSNPGLLHCRRILYQLSWRNAYNQPAAVFSNAAARFKNPRRIFHPSLLTQSHLQHNIIVCVTSHHLFHITQRSQGTDFTSPLPYSIG